MRRIGTSLLIAAAATLLAIAPSTIASANSGTASGGTVRLVRASASTVSEWTGEADLGISKSDTAPGYGPDPVSGGKVVAYRIDVTNDGPDDATNVTVTDTPSAGTVVGASGDGWDCSFTATTATCTLGYLPADGGTDLAAAGSTTDLVAATVAATPITVQVKAPASGSITDTADVWGYEDDPNGENNTTTETTTVTPANTPDFQSGFYDGINPLKLSTVFGPGDLMKTTVTIPKPSGPTPYQPGPVVDQESPASAFPGFCGPKPCDAQVAVLNPIPSGSQPDAPIRLQLIYRGTAKPGNLVYGKGDDDASAHLLPTCDSPGVARVSGDPAKCVASITLVSGDRKVVTINIADGGDPAAAKR